MRKFIAIKEKVSLYSNHITFNYNQKCHPLHLRDTWYKQFPQKKKKNFRKEGEGKKRAEEGGKKEGKGKERDGKEEKKRNGWQEFVRKEKEKEE